MRIALPLLALALLAGCDSGPSSAPPDFSGRWVTAAQEGQAPRLDVNLSFVGDGETGIVVGTGTWAGDTRVRADGWYTEREFKLVLRRTADEQFASVLATVLVGRSTCEGGTDCRAAITGAVEIPDVPFSRTEDGPGPE